MIWENVQLAFSSLLSNKMRALLTMLGIIIGIMSIITIVIIGDAMTASVSENLASLGTNNVMVNVQEKGEESNSSGFGPGGPGGPGGGTRSSSTEKQPESDDLITDDMIEELKSQFAGSVRGVSLSHSGGEATARDDELYANVNITGTNEDYFTANSITLLSGRLTNDEDVENTSYSAVVSDKFVNNMFPSRAEPIGQQIKVYTEDDIQIYNIIGVYEYESNNMFGGTGSEEDMYTDMYIPITTATLNIIEKNYTNMTVITETGEDIQQMTDRIQGWFDGVYAGNETWGISVSNMTSMMETLTSTLGTISMAIAGIAGISLVVGGIGVMNIMLVSVTERTREIGTRKALGGKNLHIRIQFVTEAVIIGLTGGIIGIILGIGLGAVITHLFGTPLVISPFIVLGSMIFSMAIGVFFGYYPANKAAKLNPIEALRYE